MKDRMTIEERLEKQLQEFENRREELERELGSTVEDIKKTLDNLMEGMAKEMSPRIAETNEIIDNYIRDFKHFVIKKNELKKEISQKRHVLDDLLAQ